MTFQNLDCTPLKYRNVWNLFLKFESVWILHTNVPPNIVHVVQADIAFQFFE